MRRNDNQQPQPRRARTVILIITAVVLLGLGGVGVYGILTPPRPMARTPATSGSPSTTLTPTPTGSQAPSRDPEPFATQVAQTLFNWDSTTDTPTAIRDRLLAWADPTGDETPGLVSDIDTYLPSADVWATLRGYGTTQTLQIDSVDVPASWPGILASASPGQLLSGTVAYTITGTRHREGVAFGQPAVSDTPVAFTMFITCAPSFPQCHLMRLGQPGNPLQ